MIHGDMTFNEVALVLGAAGLRIEKLYRQDGAWHARLGILSGHTPTHTPGDVTGIGATMADAIEDARRSLTTSHAKGTDR